MASENSHSESATKPCRTCTDFKSWAKQQKKALNESSKVNNNSYKEANNKRESMLEDTSQEINPDDRDCPLDRVHLGRKTWGLLHTMAAYYPENPTDNQKAYMKTFLKTLSLLYPCDDCARDFQEELKKNPPLVSSQHDLAQWMCRLHNSVNDKLNKPKFDCSKVNERWRDGWLDGSCD
ncbi:FAD-linked sulfhydryl oxidase ALR-like [Ctenocephalides felis]|uniref:FAD-linked sulfhydryl oxidase ALR-like n=1 Tax=Ctenocephalides felis TaxID=7515 RepID=UPI000E6E173C|nr:FAD-linked sulfhydryl oxidase ALR-like [Ctenocephalides felis]XP_026465294.1 FAD-linked sulfhydryl oxidase ALR-like [Ctenocephalides felis]